MNLQVYVDLIIRKFTVDTKVYNEVGEDALRSCVKKSLEEKYDSLIDILNLKMEIDAKNCVYNASFYEKELKKIDKEMRKHIAELLRVGHE